MMNPGRNDPCPCGSGKKYKKCCLDVTPGEVPAPLLAVHRAPLTAPAGTRNSNRVISESLAPRGVRLSPWVVARVVSSPRALDGIADPAVRASVERDLRDVWTIAKVAALSTEAIEERLCTMGVRYTREDFITSTAGRRSAWSIADLWRERDPVTCQGQEEDFLGLAACELWKRLAPAVPSMEMLDDWMQDGYALVEQRNEAAACDRWWRLWCLLVPWFDATMRDVHEADEAFQGYQSISNWCQDFEMQLENAAQRDRYYAAIGRRYCEEFIGQFTDADELLQVSFRRALARFHFGLGNTAAGEATLREIVEEWPGNVWGYVALADTWTDSGPNAMAPPPDLARAREWLERGLRTVPRDNKDRVVLQRRLDDLVRTR